MSECVCVDVSVCMTVCVCMCVCTYSHACVHKSIFQSIISNYFNFNNLNQSCLFVFSHTTVLILEKNYTAHKTAFIKLGTLFAS